MVTFFFPFLNGTSHENYQAIRNKLDFIFSKRTLNSSFTNQKKKKLAEQIVEIITKLEDIFYF